VDDKSREFDYVAGAEKSLELAKAKDWTVVSMRNDWKSVFAELPQPDRAAAPAAGR
jgi:hypothetical protein